VWLSAEDLAESFWVEKIAASACGLLAKTAGGGSFVKAWAGLKPALLAVLFALLTLRCVIGEELFLV